MKIWRVVIKNEKEENVCRIWGEATTFNKASAAALLFAANTHPDEDGLWVDEITCFGDKEFSA